MTFKDKPGSALESLIPDWVLKEKRDCDCESMRDKMNRLGTEKCKIRKNSIVNHLLRQSGHLITPLSILPENLKKSAAKRLVEKAIELSEKN